MLLFYMNKALSIVFLFIFIISTENTFAGSWGKGEVKLTKRTMEQLMMYMYGAGNSKYHGKRKNKPDIFALSKDGKYTFYYYCPHPKCMPPDQPKVIKYCERNSKGSPCGVFALKRRIVWKNGGKKLRIKRKDLKSPYKVAKLIQDAGFYDGDISNLAGIDVKSGQIDDKITVTGEKKIIDNSGQNDTDKSNTDFVKQLGNLKQLYEDGLLTEEEFNKAKKKLLSE